MAAFVQSAHSGSFGGTVTLSHSAISTGSLLVIVVNGNGHSDVPSAIADSHNSYTQWSAASSQNSFPLITTVWYVLSATAGATSTTLTGSITANAHLYEFSGTSFAVGTFGILQNQTNANPENGATVTPSTTSTACVSTINSKLSGSGATGVSGPWTGFTSDVSCGNVTMAAYAIPGSTSPQTPSFTGSSGGSEYCSSSVAFTDATGGAGLPPGLGPDLAMGEVEQTLSWLEASMR